MAEDSSTNAAPPPAQSPRQRRSSFAGQTFAELFSSHRPSVQRDGNNSPPAHASGPITQAAAEAQRRRLSLTTLGLSGSPGSSPFGSYRGLGRRGSIGSDNSGSIDESAIEDEWVRDPNTSSTPVTPFARRVSFGARAMRDIRNSLGGGGGGGAVGQNGTKSPPRASSAANATVKGPISSRETQKGRGPSLPRRSSHPVPSHPISSHSIPSHPSPSVGIRCRLFGPSDILTRSFPRRIGRLLVGEYAQSCRTYLCQPAEWTRYGVHAQPCQKRRFNGDANQGNASGER